MHPPRSPSSRLLQAAVVLLLVTAGLAGCLGGDEDVSPESTTNASDALEFDPRWSEHALASGDGHDHADPAHHRNLTTPNFETLGHTPLISDAYGTTPRGNLCGDAAPAGERDLAVVESRGDVAFTLADVTDRADPQRLGELVMRTTYVYDMAVVPDGDHVVLITSQPKTPHQEPGQWGPDRAADSGLAWRSPCTGGEEVAVGWNLTEAFVPRTTSMLLVDITDPADPTIVDQHPVEGLGHSVTISEVENVTWILGSTWGATSGTSTFRFVHLVDFPGGTRMVPVTEWSLTLDPGSETTNLTRSMGHNEGIVRAHPVTGDTLAWLALWDHGMIVLDLEDPRTPEVVGRWSDYDPDTGDDTSGNVHEAIPMTTTADGRHYTFVGPELVNHPQGRPSGVVRVLDTTDPTRPQEVAGWTLPHEVEWRSSLQFSPHYLDWSGRTLFASFYHGGVWAMDLGPVLDGDAGVGNWTALDAVGVYMPNGNSPAPPEDGFRWAPTMEEVHALPDGTLVTFDSNSGLYTFRFDEDQPAPAPDGWPVEPAHR